MLVQNYFNHVLREGTYTIKVHQGYLLINEINKTKESLPCHQFAHTTEAYLQSAKEGISYQELYLWEKIKIETGYRREQVEISN